VAQLQGLSRSGVWKFGVVWHHNHKLLLHAVACCSPQPGEYIFEFFNRFSINPDTKDIFIAKLKQISDLLLSDSSGRQRVRLDNFISILKVGLSCLFHATRGCVIGLVRNRLHV